MPEPRSAGRRPFPPFESPGPGTEVPVLGRAGGRPGMKVPEDPAIVAGGGLGSDLGSAIRLGADLPLAVGTVFAVGAISVRRIADPDPEAAEDQPTAVSICLGFVVVVADDGVVTLRTVDGEAIRGEGADIPDIRIFGCRIFGCPFAAACSPRIFGCRIFGCPFAAACSPREGTWRDFPAFCIGPSGASSLRPLLIEPRSRLDA